MYHTILFEQCSIRHHTTLDFIYVAGGSNCLKNIDITDIDWATRECRIQTRSGDDAFDHSTRQFFADHNLEDAETWQEALEQYFLLKDDVL